MSKYNYRPTATDQLGQFASRLTKGSFVSTIDHVARRFTLYKDERLLICYAPFDYVNRKARLAIIGITPGFEQARRALNTARVALNNRLSLREASQRAKYEASFDGAIRETLVKMLNVVEINRALEIRSCAELWGEKRVLFHPTSVIRHPVFRRKRKLTNYCGEPTILRHSILRRYVEKVLARELTQLPDALVVPLGVVATSALNHLIDNGRLGSERVLLGFPHPSGQNMNKVKLLLRPDTKDDRRVRAAMVKKVNQWFKTRR